MKTLHKIEFSSIQVRLSAIVFVVQIVIFALPAWKLNGNAIFLIFATRNFINQIDR